MTHVLAVDDNSNNLYLVRFLLERSGCTVDEALNGKEAVDMALKNNYSLILMDIQMPIMDGIAAAREIRRHKPEQKIVAITARAMPSELDELKLAGFDDFLEKPFEPTIFVDTIKPFLEATAPTQLT